MIRRPPRSTQSRSSAASDVYKRQELIEEDCHIQGNQRIRDVCETVCPYIVAKRYHQFHMLHGRQEVELRQSGAKPVIGAHVSTAGGVSKVPGRAQDIRASVAQIFPSNPRKWEGKRPGQEDLHGLGVYLGQMNISLFIHTCLLYTSPSPRDGLLSRMPSSA